MLVPALAFAGPVLVMARSAPPLTVVSKVAVLLAALLSLVVLATMAMSVSAVPLGKVGRASCRGRVEMSAVAVSLKKKTTKEGGARPLPMAGKTRLPAGSRWVIDLI